MIRPKFHYYSNDAMRSAAEYRPCAKCKRKTGTEVRAHYCGIGQHRLGKGTGIKPSDACSAVLCMQCHSEFDQYKRANDYERAWEFLMLCWEELHRDIAEGLIG